MRAWPLLMALLTCAMPAHADPASEANTRFLWGRELYGKGRYREALSEFSISNRLSPNPAPALGVARAYRFLELYEESFTAYAEYLDHPISEAERARALTELEQVLPRIARLRVETTPPGATLWLDRKNLGSLGVSPRTFAAAPGEHLVIMALDGHREETRTVTLTRGAEVVLRVPLTLRTGPLSISSRPAGAVVRRGDADGPVLGTTPVHLALPIGPTQLHLAAPGHEPAQPTVVISETATITLDLALATIPPPRGRVRVETNVAAALVLVDGKEAGFSPLVVSVDEGPHEVRVQKPGYQPFRVEVAARPEVTLAVESTLEPLPKLQERGPWPWVTLGVTAAAGAVTTVLGVQALSASSDFDRAPSAAGLDRVERLNLATDLMLSLTAIAAGATAATFLLSDEPEAAVSSGRVVEPAEAAP
jgi:outer membrane receptor for ferrienterochelin and colicins